MNGNLSTDTYQYRVNQEYRDAAMRSAENQRLAHVAAELTSRWSLFAGVRQWLRKSIFTQSSNGRHQRTLHRVLHLPTILALVIAMVLATSVSQPAQAQSRALNDPGPDEVYQPALAVFRVGYFYQIRGDQQRAIEEFTKAIELLPSYGYSYAARGDSYALIGDYQAAIDDYTVALSIYPDYVSALTTRGRAYAQQGQYDLALADFANAMTQMPDYAPAYRAAGDVLYQLGEMDEALNDYHIYTDFTNDRPT